MRKNIFNTITIASTLFILLIFNPNYVSANCYNSDNYYEIACGIQNIRWHISPITYTIIPKDEYYELIKKAFSSWQENSNNLIQFKEVEEEKQANIIVYTKKNLNENENLRTCYFQGINNIQSEGNSIYKATIQLSYINKYTNEKISHNIMYQTALHEIGHALGLVNHSTNNNDILYPSVYPLKKTLSNADINTIKMLYSDCKIETKLRKNFIQHEIDKLFEAVLNNPENAFLHIQLAKLYIKNKDYKNALIDCNKALKIQPNNDKARYQKGIILYEQKKYRKSYSEFLKLVKNNPDNSVYLFALIKVSCKINKINQSKVYFENFKKNYDNDEFTVLTEKLINNK